MAAPQQAKPAMSPEASVLAPGVKVPQGAQGYLLTLVQQNAWWKVNTCLEAMELIKSAYKDINGADVMPPALEPHAVAGAPGALFIAQGAAQGAKDASPVAIAHRLLEMVATDKEAAAIGEHLMRVLPVEETCTVDNSEIEAMADKLMRKHLPEGGQPMTFAVRPEAHSPHLGTNMSMGDLVRRVADKVPREHTVRLEEPTQKTVLLMVVADCAMLSVVDDWHALHKFNVKEMRHAVEA